MPYPGRVKPPLIQDGSIGLNEKKNMMVNKNIVLYKTKIKFYEFLINLRESQQYDG